MPEMEEGMRNPRPYQTMQDLVSSRALLMVGRKSAPGTHYIHIGDLNWWLYYTEDAVTSLRNLYLWEEGSNLAGWALLSPAWQSFDVFVHPELLGSREAAAMMDWAARQAAQAAAARGQTEIRTMWIRESDRRVTENLTGLGFTPDVSGLVCMQRPLDQPLPAPRLPEGFHVRPVDGLEEAPARAAASHAAFGSGWPMDRYLRRYLSFMRSPVYLPEFDIVAVSPDGKHAAFCICWPDPVNKIGLLEPVGTHPDFRRMGLGRAVILEGLRRLQAWGMRSALVCTESDQTAAVHLYESAGFSPAYSLQTYKRPI